MNKFIVKIISTDVRVVFVKKVIQNVMNSQNMFSLKYVVVAILDE